MTYGLFPPDVHPLCSFSPRPSTGHLGAHLGAVAAAACPLGLYLLPAEPGGVAFKDTWGHVTSLHRATRCSGPRPTAHRCFGLWPALPTSQLQPWWLLTACLFLPQGLCRGGSLCLDPSSLPAFILTRVTTSEGPHGPPELTQAPLIPPLVRFLGKH